MKYEILDHDGGCHRTVDCQDAAFEILLDLASANPDSAAHLEILETDDQGQVHGFLLVDRDRLVAGKS